MALLTLKPTSQTGFDLGKVGLRCTFDFAIGAATFCDRIATVLIYHATTGLCVQKKWDTCLSGHGF